jgi:sporulation protein YlmC with PRC-barrel domain
VTTDTRADELTGAEVYRATGERIGAADQVYCDERTGAAEWVGVRTGLFGTHHSLIPLSEAAVVDRRIVVPFSREHIRDAPSVDAGDAHPTPEEAVGLYAHYGLRRPGS